MKNSQKIMTVLSLVIIFSCSPEQNLEEMTTTPSFSPVKEVIEDDTEEDIQGETFGVSNVDYES